MAVFVGSDLADVESVDASIDAHGDRYLSRIYTEEERDEYRMDTRKLTTRFAAKEATMNALGGFDEPLPWATGACGAAVVIGETAS
jgi:holo-[acyl-carrier protein] synthase